MSDGKQLFVAFMWFLAAAGVALVLAAANDDTMSRIIEGWEAP